jgi:hypothetical protein
MVLVLVVLIVGIGVYFYFSLGLGEGGGVSVPLTAENLPLILQDRLAKYLPEGITAGVNIGGVFYTIVDGEVILSDNAGLSPGEYDIEIEAPDDFFKIVDDEGVCSAARTVSISGEDKIPKTAVARIALKNKDLISGCA